MSEVQQYINDRNKTITFSETAICHVINYLTKHPGSQGIRLAVKKTGCSGLSYVVDYVDAPQEQDLIQQLSSQLKLFIDKSSYPFLKGMHVDYVKEGLNQKFVFTNPNQTGQCGCGESFTVES